MRPILLFLVALAFAGSGCTHDAGPTPGDSSADPATTSESGGGDAASTSSGMPEPAGSEDSTGAAPPAPGPESSDSPEYTRESAKELLVRTWVIDTQHMMQSERFDEMTPEQAQQARALIAMIQMEMTFTDSQVTTTMGMMGESQTEVADYEIARIEGDEIILSATDAAGRKDEITVTHDGERLTFRAPDGSFVLREKE